MSAEEIVTAVVHPQIHRAKLFHASLILLSSSSLIAISPA